MEITKKINVLITSAGRRVSLVKNFQQHCNVFTCDANPKFSAACQYSKKFFKVPLVTDNNYIDVLWDICNKYKINIIVPTIDPELVVLSEVKDDFSKKDILIAVSDKLVCKTFSLKTLTEKFFLNRGFLTPRIINNLKSANYPLFAKLNNSSSSKGATIVSSIEEAEILIRRNKNYIFQEYVDGIEFTVDVFVNSKGKVISIVPRQRIEVRGGEVSKGKTCKDITIIENVKKLINNIKGAYGVLTIQLFKKNNKIYFIEINPRFGGGYPLSWLAGADFAKYLIDDYLGKDLVYNEAWQDNLIMLRYDAEVIIKDNDNSI